MKKSYDFEGHVNSIILIIMLTIVFFNVLSRYIFHWSISYLEELVCILFVLLSTVGGAAAAKSESHYTLDLLAGVLKPKAKNRVFIINNSLTLIVAVSLVITSTSMVLHQYKMGSVSYSLELPEWIYGTTVPIGLTLMSFRLIQRIYSRIKQWNEGELQ